MKFDAPATTNPIDQLKIVGHPTDRIDGPLKTTGTARYAYERHDVVANPAYGYVLGAAIAKGSIMSMDLSGAKSAPGVLAVVTADSAGKLDKGDKNTADLLGGPEIEHYHQAIALVVAETFEQARAAARSLRSTIRSRQARSISRPARARRPSRRPAASLASRTRPSATSPVHLPLRRSSLTRRTLRRTTPTR